MAYANIWSEIGIEDVKAAIIGYQMNSITLFTPNYWLPGVNTEKTVRMLNMLKQGKKLITTYHSFEFKDGKWNDEYSYQN